jgi:hypothetical protein
MSSESNYAHSLCVFLSGLLIVSHVILFGSSKGFAFVRCSIIAARVRELWRLQDYLRVCSQEHCLLADNLNVCSLELLETPMNVQVRKLIIALTVLGYYLGHHETWTTCVGITKSKVKLSS